MLAMRACRSSIMIGKALNLRQMRRVLDNLATLQAPWNCPHGGAANFPSPQLSFCVFFLFCYSQYKLNAFVTHSLKAPGFNP
jgi:hypothetical protein